MTEHIAHTGAWGIALFTTVVVSRFLYRYPSPGTWKEWASAGVVQAFVIDSAGDVCAPGGYRYRRGRDAPTSNWAASPEASRLSEILSGRLCDKVAEQAREWSAELIVLGTHGRRGVGRMFLGSDAEQIVRTATVPVLLIRTTEAVAQTKAAGTPR